MTSNLGKKLDGLKKSEKEKDINKKENSNIDNTSNILDQIGKKADFKHVNSEFMKINENLSTLGDGFQRNQEQMKEMDALFKKMRSIIDLNQEETITTFIRQNKVPKLKCGSCGSPGHPYKDRNAVHLNFY